MKLRLSTLVGVSLALFLFMFTLNVMFSGMGTKHRDSTEQPSSYLDFSSFYKPSEPVILKIEPWPYGYQDRQPARSLRLRLEERIKSTVPVRIVLKNHEDDNTIPRIIHQSWIDTNIPVKTKDWVKKWQTTNPQWTYMFWTDSSAREFVKKFFPMLLKRYDAYESPVQRTDMFRYIVMFAFGGVYADLDVEPLKSLEPIRDWNTTCILSTEPDAHAHVASRLARDDTNNTLACNAFMACRPRHPFMFFLLSMLIKNMEDRAKLRRFRHKKNKCPLEETVGCTGPLIASQTLTYYRKSYADLFRKYPDDDVMSARSDYFLPTFADHAVKKMKEVCGSKKVKLTQQGKVECERLKEVDFRNNNVTSDSLTNHHWLDSYHFKGKWETVSLHSLVENPVLFPDTDFDVIISNYTNPYGVS